MSIDHDCLMPSEREWLFDAAERGRPTRDHATSIALLVEELVRQGDALAAAVIRALAKQAGIAE
jgi:hypothetical protein